MECLVPTGTSLGGPSFDPRTVEARGEDPTSGEATSTVLARIRVELVGLLVDVLDLQRTLGPTLSAAAGDVSVAKAAQGLDLVAQSLDGLSVFIGMVVALDEGGSGRVDVATAAAQVRLGQLSSRLAAPFSERPEEHVVSELELF